MPLMMEVLRQHSKSFIIYLLFGIIIVVFVISFGPGSECGSKGETLAAEVNGQRIPVTEFDAQFRQQEKDTAEARKAAMDQIVEREILAQEAAKLGLFVSDKQMAKKIRGLKGLWKDGKFEMEYYKRYVNGMLGSSIPVFEARFRKELMGDGLRALLTQGLYVSEVEIEAEWKLRNTKIELEYLAFDEEGDKNAIVVTPAEVATWKAANKAKIDDHWKNKRFLYFSRKEYKVRQIALNLPKDADVAVKGPIQKKADELKKELDAGKDFAELAKLHSQDEATKAAGGDMGMVERDKMPSPEFKKAANETAVGKVSNVFCDLKACRVIKVESTREKELKDLEDEIAASLLKEERVSAGAKEKAQKIITALKANPQTELKSFAPTLTPEQKKKIDEKKDADKKLREKLAKQFADQKGFKFDLPPSADGSPYATTGEFPKARNFLIPKIGISKELMKAAFGLKKKGDLVPEAIKVDKKLYVVRLAKESAAAAPKDEDLQSIRRELWGIRASRLYEGWLDDLRKTAALKVNSKMMKTPERKLPTKEEKPAPAPAKKG